MKNMKIFVVSSFLSMVIWLPGTAAAAGVPAGLADVVTELKAVESRLDALISEKKYITHMGRSPEDHVLLSWVSGVGHSTVCEPSASSGGQFERILPDGTIVPDPFVVPNGKYLVVTDFDAVVGEGSVPEFDHTIQAVLVLEPQVGTGVYFAHTTEGKKERVDHDNVAMSSHLGAGFVVASGLQICAEGFERWLGGFRERPVGNGTVRGYLVDKKP